MRQNKVSKYTIELDIARSDETNKNINSIEKALESISTSAKDIDITGGLAAATKQADKLAESVKYIARNSDDCSKEMQAFERAANKSISELAKQYAKIDYSLSEQGVAQRQRLAELREQQKALAGSKKERKRYNELSKEIKALEKDVVEGSDDELRAAMATNRALRAKLKLTQTEVKLEASRRKSEVGLSKLIKSDLQSLRDRLKEQLKFISALKTTEGRYNAIKKAAGKIGKIGVTAAKGAGFIGAGALALGGAAIASAGNIQEREQQARRIKGGFSDEIKNEILGDLYIRTGADYSSIVDAINRVQSVIGAKDRTSIVEAATAEIRFPGAAAMFRQDNQNNINAVDFTKYTNRLKAVQGATGASVDQISSSTERIANMRQSAFSNASMTDLQALYLGLQNSGAFDTQEELDRAFNSFVRAQRSQNESVFDFAQRYDWTSRVWGATNKQQAQKAISNLDFGAIQNAASVDSATESRTKAELTSENIRRMEEQRNRVMMQLLEAIYPIFEKLNTSDLQKLFQGLMDLVLKIVPPLIDVLNAVTPYIDKIVSVLTTTISKIYDVISGDWTWGPNSRPQLAESFSNGGVASMPSLCGESGAEMVIPLDHSRSSRASNLTQYYTQSFVMAGNETTALSLSQAVKSRDFARAISSNYRTNKRLGR